MYAIETNQLCKKYGQRTVVRNLNLNVQTGELFSLLGTNGAGKTTTIKLLSGLTAPTSGQALLMEKDVVTDPHGAKSLLAVSPQETAVAPHLTIYENLIFMARLYGLSSEEAQQQTLLLADQFGLMEHLREKPLHLSGGWKRRLSLALALVSQPQILFLDEPTLGLDVLARRDLWEYIRSLKGKITIVLTTHYLEEAEALSDRVGLLKEGNLMAVGSVPEIKQQTGCSSLEEAFIALLKEA